MKKLIYIITFLLLVSISLGKDIFRTDAIYVKFKSDSKLSNLQSNSSQYTISPVINSKMVNNLDFTPKQAVLIEELSFIKRIKFQDEIDPFKTARHFAQRADVEYAEPIPISTIVDNETNDPEIERLYQVYITQAAEAWKLMTGDTVTIAIVDTGMDFDHEDLEGIVWYNKGEMGQDAQGNDKNSNGIDDDDNGFVDDWRGWDFGSESGYDNDPSYGGDHGVHVAGIAAAESNNEIGIAGMCPLAKIIAVKVGPDFGLDNSVYNEYEGLLYAASLGADVINCSWGATGFSLTNKLIVNTAIELGSVIVAAAGNNGRNERFYPASFDNVISVASTTDEDTRSGFSNYSPAVDISAPGTFIYSTIPDNKYEYKSGTSMASPVVAGAAGVLRSQFPKLTPKQIKSLLVANADNIDELNSNYAGFLGNGRLNLLKAINKEKNQAIVLNDYRIIADNSIGIIETGTTIRIDFQFENVLEYVDNVELLINNDEFFPFKLNNEIFDFSSINSGELFEIDNQLFLSVPDDLPENYVYNLRITATIDGERSQDFFITFVANQSYINLKNEQIALTISSNGNLGYNDYPDNAQGIGLQYGEALNVLFEGGFMIADVGRYEGVIDGIRKRSGEKDKDFFAIEKITYQENDTSNIVKAVYNDFSEFDLDLDSIDLNVKVTQESFIFNEIGLEKSVLLKYELSNENNYDVDSVYAGLFYDWDLSSGGSNDFIYFDTLANIGFVEAPDNSDLPVVSVKMHSQENFNCYAIDNAAFKDEMGIYDGFTEEEKFMTLTSGKKRLMSRINKDASMVLGAGPIFIPANETHTLYFSINIADSKQDASIAAEQIQRKVENLESITSVKKEKQIKILKFTPNPINNNSTAEILIWSKEYSDVILNVYDSRGREVINLGNRQLTNGYNPVSIRMNGLSQGAYYMGVINQGELFSFPFTILNE